MIRQLLHAAGVRLVLGLAGTALFVESSIEPSRGGIALMVAASALIIAVGADVAYRPAKSVGHA